MTDQAIDPSIAPISPPLPALRRRRMNFGAVDPMHSGMSVHRYVGMHVLGAIFPICAGLMFYGWRAVGAIILVVGSTLGAVAVWRQIGLRGARLRIDQSLWLAMLLALMLPAQLCSKFDTVSKSHATAWPILVSAGVTLATLLWLIGGVGTGRIHPVLIAHLLMVVLFQDMISPRYALKREHSFVGDVLDAAQPAPGDEAAAAEPIEQARPAWIAAEPDYDPHAAIRSLPAAERLESFTGGHETPERVLLSLESLVRDRLPPLEDLIIGGQPAPIGQSSAVAIIIGGLFLLYRGVIDYRVPLLICVSALVCFLILPVPVVITGSSRIAPWLPMRNASVGVALGVTFANYELMASPLLFTAFFLATSPPVRPLARRARAVYAVLLGIVSAIFQLYVSVAIGPYLALLGVSLLTPTLDNAFRPQPLI